VVGVGAFGRNHARVYHQLQQAGEVRLVGVVDPDTVRADAVAREFACKSFGSIEQMLTTHSEVQAASVAVPTVLHRKVASALMEAGVDVLIEKPVAATLADADALVRVASEHSRVAQVGHLERFNPAVIALRRITTTPLFFEIHRMSVFTPRSLDVDVVLDLMIHDVDIVLSLVGRPPEEIRAAGLCILTEKVDIANVRLAFPTGCIANLTASRVSTERVRKLRVFQPSRYISLDYQRQDLLTFDVQDAPDSPSKEIHCEAATVEKGEPLKLELDAFLRSMATRSPAPVTGEEGLAALEVALDILAKIEEHTERVREQLVR